MTQNDTRRRPNAALAAATILTLPLGAIYAFSVFIAPLETALGASRSDLASVFGISVVAFTVGLNLASKAFGLIPVTWLVALSMGLSALGVAIAAMAPDFLWLAFGYGVLFAVGGGVAYVVAQQTVNASPLSRPGLVNGYLVSLFPLGAMIAAPVCGWSIGRFGVRETLGGLAVTVALCGVIGAGLIWRSGVTLARPAKTAATAGDDTLAETARLRSVFIRLFLVFLFAASAGLMVLSQVVVIVEAYGASKALAIAAATGITAAIAAARLAGGWLVDRFPVPTVAGSAQGIAFIGAVLLVLVPRPETAIASLALIGIGYGVISGVAAGAVAMFWPKALFGQVVSRVYIAWCLAALTLPVVGAKVFEITGAYHWAIALAGVANLCGAIVGAMLPRQAAEARLRPA